MFIDSHAHLDDRQYKADQQEVIERASKNGVTQIVCVGYDLPSSKRVVALAKRYANIFAAVGIHPHDAQDTDESTWAQLYELGRDTRVVAIGEMGLDYYRNLSPRDVQQAVFRRQINLAKELGLPIIIHDRDAHGDVLRIMKEEKVNEVGGVLHCFSGSWEMAQECLKLGFYISLAGPVTFANARGPQEIAQKVPLDRLLVETDCPYLTPDTWRGQRNEPAYVKRVAEKIAALRRISLEEVAEATTANARCLFRLLDKKQ
ncbi:MAG: TatD family hydrolase [Firmicutes bacterium]|nr:TatD family hydrolase [Bacillota bacterium]